MAYLLLLLSVLAFVGAFLLLRSDNQGTEVTTPEPAKPAALEGRPAHDAPRTEVPKELAQRQLMPSPAELEAPKVEAKAEPTPEPKAEPLPDAEPKHEPEAEPETGPKKASVLGSLSRKVITRGQDEPTPEPQREPGVQPEQVDEPKSKGTADDFDDRTFQELAAKFGLGDASAEQDSEFSELDWDKAGQQAGPVEEAERGAEPEPEAEIERAPIEQHAEPEEDLAPEDDGEPEPHVDDEPVATRGPRRRGGIQEDKTLSELLGENKPKRAVRHKAEQDAKPEPKPDDEPQERKKSRLSFLSRFGFKGGNKAATAGAAGAAGAAAGTADATGAAAGVGNTAEESQPAPKPKTKDKPWAKPKGKRAEPNRKTWAETHGFSYIKDDDFLLGEFTRGAAATGAPATNVATGSAYGHESRVFDIANTPVIAMNTGAVSEVVVDMRRDGHGWDAAGGQSDLVEIEEVHDFTVLATEPDAARRFLDVRVATALEMLPDNVTAVWFETEWVLAQLTPGSEPTDAIFAPLAMLADTARTLPPQTAPLLELPQGSREEVEPVDAPDTPAEADEAPRRPSVVRPEQPMDLPTRTTGGVRGAVEEHEVGEDDIAPIADGEEAPKLNDGTRARSPRPAPPPSIF